MSVETVTFRPATQEDVPSIVAVNRASLVTDYVRDDRGPGLTLDHWLKKTDAVWETGKIQFLNKHLRDPDNSLFVAELGTVGVTGFAWVGRKGEAGAKRARFEAAYILERYRGVSIGTRLGERVLQWVDEQGVSEMDVGVADFLYPSRAFYEQKLGFWPNGTIYDGGDNKPKEFKDIDHTLSDVSAAHQLLLERLGMSPIDSSQPFEVE